VRSAVVLVVVAIFTLANAPVNGSQAEFIVEPDATVQATFNGHPARMLMRGVGSTVPLLNPQSAADFGLKPAFIRSGISFKVGPTRVNGKNGTARYTIGGLEQKRRIGWFERDIAPGYDGLLGPLAFSHPIVTMRLRSPRAGEQPITFGLSTFGYFGAGVVLRSKPLTMMQFDPSSPTTIANAPFASEASGPLRGHFVSEVHSRLIALGVARPVRTLQFETPLTFGALRIERTEVRMQDWGSTASIPEAAPDPDEIIVSALSKNDKQLRFIILGADALRNCSSVTFDKLKRQIRLSCAPASGE
jgi:hypothetical protein